LFFSPLHCTRQAHLCLDDAPRSALYEPLSLVDDSEDLMQCWNPLTSGPPELPMALGWTLHRTPALSPATPPARATSAQGHGDGPCRTMPRRVHTSPPALPSIYRPFHLSFGLPPHSFNPPQDATTRAQHRSPSAERGGGGYPAATACKEGQLAEAS
jgi:hypothetical protein